VVRQSLAKRPKDRPSLVIGGEALRLKYFLTERQLWLPRVFHRISNVAGAVADEKVSGDLLIQTIEAAMREIKQPSLPIEFGSTIRTLDMGLYGMVIQTASTVAQALEHSVRFFRLIMTANRVSLDRHNNAIEWVFRSDQPGGLGIRVRNEIILTEHVAIMRYIAPGVEPIRVSFTHAKPKDTEAHRRFFACPVIWNAAQNSVQWPAQFLTRPLGVDPSLGQFILEEANRRLASLSLTDSIGEITGAILRRLPHGDADLATIAVLLGRSPRTMRRELTDQGFTFTKLRDSLRQRLAGEMLSSGQHSVTQIASSLGFSETSAYSRAARRWKTSSSA
jgi:AraC-like DNA-binding protein